MSNTVIIVNPDTRTTTNSSDLEIVKGNHDHMPSRTNAYEPTDERGHNNASSLGGSNGKDNVFAQSKDLNHGAYLQMENGEKYVLRAGGSIHSDKTAFVSNQPGGRPDSFMVNDHITYTNGTVQDVHHSFTNLSIAEQESLNASLQEHTDMLNDPNPGDTLRDHMSSNEYSHVMEETDASLPSVRDSYDGNWISNTHGAAETVSESTWSFDMADVTMTESSTGSAGSEWGFESPGEMDITESICSGESFSDNIAGDVEVSADEGGTGVSGAGAEGADPGSTDDGGVSFGDD